MDALKQFKGFQAGVPVPTTVQSAHCHHKLLDEAIVVEGNEDSLRPATRHDINRAVDSIKSAMVSLPRSQAAPLSFADAVRTLAGLWTATPRLPLSAEAQEKEIFVSLKNVNVGHSMSPST